MGYRPRKRRSNQFDLYSSETVLGWSVLRFVTGAKGEEMVALVRWRRVFDELGNHAGYQICSSGMSDLVVVPSKPSSTGIARHEMQLNALGHSRTHHLSEREKDRREKERPTNKVGKALPHEDAVERIQAKVRVWPDVTPAAQSILEVWPK